MLVSELSFSISPKADKESLAEIVMNDSWREDLPREAPFNLSFLIDNLRKLKFA
jgi:hypothetical protein